MRLRDTLFVVDAFNWIVKCLRQIKSAEKNVRLEDVLAFVSAYEDEFFYAPSEQTIRAHFAEDKP